MGITLEINEKPVVTEVKKVENLDPKVSRFKDALWFSPGLEIILVGAGGIGSYTALLLARQQAKIYLYDFDLIESHNRGGQLYKTKDIGLTKTAAIANTIREFTEQEIVQCGEFNSESAVLPIMISALDNMKTRKLIFAVTKGREEQYEATLFDDAEIPDQPCNYKATSHCGALIGSLIVATLNNYITNKVRELDLREVPFKHTFDLALLNFRTDEIREVYSS